MKIKDGFVKTRVVDGWVIVPVDETSDLGNFVIQINETGAIIWDGIEAGETPVQIAESIVAEYEVDSEKAKQDLAGFLSKMKELHILED